MYLLGNLTLNLTRNFLYQLSISESSDEDSPLSIYFRACQHAKEVSFQVESFLGFVSSFQVSAVESRDGVPMRTPSQFSYFVTSASQWGCSSGACLGMLAFPDP